MGRRGNKLQQEEEITFRRIEVEAAVKLPGDSSAQTHVV